MFEERTIDMDQISQTYIPPAWRGAFYMVLAGIAFAIINSLSFQITAVMQFKSQSDLFWQYAIALVFSLPFLLKHGASSLKTSRPLLHIVRVILSVLGLQAFNMAFAYGEPTWKVVALVMTSPFFVMLGAKYFLGESVGPHRWLAAIVAFAGAMIVLQPWSTSFGIHALLPIVAAVLWGIVSLMTKSFTSNESPISLTVWLLLLMTPINAGMSLAAGFEWPSVAILKLLLIGGVLVMFAQYCLSKSYSLADAAYVQPFDDLKLIANVLAFGLFFGYWPEGNLWLGILLILAASTFLLLQERHKVVPLLPEQTTV
jgi:drug/metabolite transporter (DMT)-like permease